MGWFLTVMLAMGMGLITSNFAHSQPAIGTKITEQMALGGGSSIPLPPGEWMLTSKTSSFVGRVNWDDIMVLKNTSPNPVVAYLAIRHAQSNVKWGNTYCSSQNSQHFLVNLHGTMESSLINKCSHAYVWGNAAEVISDRSKSRSDWWSPMLPGLGDLSQWNRSLIFVEFRVQQFNGKGIDVELFVIPPSGTNLAAFKKDGIEKKLTINHEILSQWISLYVESVEQSFLNKKPAKMLGLAFNTKPDTATASASVEKTNGPAVAVIESPKDPHLLVKPSEPAIKPSMPAAESISKPPASSMASTEVVADKTPASSVAGQVLTAERQAFEKEKLALAEQMAQMKQMLAELQKSNALALANQQSSQTPAPDSPQTAPVFANRKALVIGNDLYIHVSKLSNAGMDAEAMATALTSVGYKVWKHMNLDEDNKGLLFILRGIF